MRMEKMISLMIEEDLLAKLDSLASEKDRSRSWLIRKAIELFIKEERGYLPNEGEHAED